MLGLPDFYQASLDIDPSRVLLFRAGPDHPEFPPILGIWLTVKDLPGFPPSTGTPLGPARDGCNWAAGWNPDDAAIIYREDLPPVEPVLPQPRILVPGDGANVCSGMLPLTGYEANPKLQKVSEKSRWTVSLNSLTEQPIASRSDPELGPVGAIKPPFYPATWATAGLPGGSAVIRFEPASIEWIMGKHGDHSSSQHPPQGRWTHSRVVRQRQTRQLGSTLRSRPFCTVKSEV